VEGEEFSEMLDPQVLDPIIAKIDNGQQLQMSQQYLNPIDTEDQKIIETINEMASSSPSTPH